MQRLSSNGLRFAYHGPEVQARMDLLKRDRPVERDSDALSPVWLLSQMHHPALVPFVHRG